MSGHADGGALPRDPPQFLPPLPAPRRWLLYEDVLALLERLLGKRIVCRHGRGDHDRVELVVCEEVAEIRGCPRSRVARSERLAYAFVGVADPGELRQLVEVARQVRPPVAEPDD